jgi:LPXTG-motif cell wall-anchored protein
MFRRILMLTAAVLVATVGVAEARPGGYSTGGTITVDDSTVSPGQVVKVSGTGCAPGSTVTLQFVGPPAGTPVNTTAGSDGSFSGNVTIPTNATAGANSIRATCGSLVQNVTVTVSVGGTGLARTGTDSSLPLTTIGIGLVAAGGFVVLIARRRRVASPA